MEKKTKERIIALAEAGFTVYEISKILTLNIESARAIFDDVSARSKTKDYITLQQILTELKEESRLMSTRAEATRAEAATLESQALALLKARLVTLQESSSLTQRDSYELCAILKALQPYLNASEALVLDKKAVVEVQFV